MKANYVLSFKKLKYEKSITNENRYQKINCVVSGSAVFALMKARLVFSSRKFLRDATFYIKMRNNSTCLTWCIMRIIHHVFENLQVLLIVYVNDCNLKNHKNFQQNIPSESCLASKLWQLPALGPIK